MRTSSNVAAQGGRKDGKEGIRRRIPDRILQGRPTYPGDHARDPLRSFLFSVFMFSFFSFSVLESYQTPLLFHRISYFFESSYPGDHARDPLRSFLFSVFMFSFFSFSVLESYQTPLLFHRISYFFESSVTWLRYDPKR